MLCCATLVRYDTYQYDNTGGQGSLSECSMPCNRTLLSGDGYCDDGNNHCGCNWDGGDCCGNEPPVLKDYCDRCACLDPDYSDYCGYKCDKPAHQGDGLCDDEVS